MILVLVVAAIKPFGCLILLLPGAVLAAAVGHKAHTVLAGLLTLVVLHGHVVLLALFGSAFPRGSSAPELIDAAAVTVLALVGGLPPLVHLRSRSPER